DSWTQLSFGMVGARPMQNFTELAHMLQDSKSILVEKKLVDDIIAKYTTHASDLLSRTGMASKSSYKPIAGLKQFGNTRKPREPTADSEMHAYAREIEFTIANGSFEQSEATSDRPQIILTTSHNKA
ncbi:hypothetical protein RUND412_005215, partial [Rhizina undulata]